MMRIRRFAPFLGAFLSVFLISQTAIAQGKSASAKARLFGIGHPKSVQDLPEGQLRRDIEKLPPSAKGKALGWLQRFEFPIEDVKSLRVNSKGEVLYEDSFSPSGATMDEAPESAPLTVDPTEIFNLQSRPGSSNVVFLDFDGHVLDGTSWSNSTLTAMPFDPSGNDVSSTEADFTEDELRRIFEIWHRVSEDYAAFDVNVTTQEPDVITNRTARILFTHDTDASGKSMPSQGAGGVAYVNVFGLSNYAERYNVAFVYYTNLSTNNYGVATYNAEAASHEFGHQLGLSHDGKSGVSAYYEGHGEGLVSWAPIMGNSYYRNVTQWSNGDYEGANNTQNDIAVIAGDLGYVPDDHGDTAEQATMLVVEANGDILVSSPEFDPHNALTQNKGVIDDRNDVDWFVLNVQEQSELQLTATPAWHSFTSAERRGANLDIELSLFDAALNPLDFSEPTTDTDSHLSIALDTGIYYIQVDGVGNNTLSSYTDYSSLGMYFLEGQLSSGTVTEDPDITPPSPSVMGWESVPESAGQDAITMTAVTATDESGTVEYYFTCVAGDANCLDSGWQAERNFTAGGLTAATYYAYNVRARDAFGNETTPSETKGTTTDTPPDPEVDVTPPSPSTMAWESPPEALGENAITMTAVVATDESGGVEYYFSCVDGDSNCVDSGWQSERDYTLSGLTADTYYSFNVKARDAHANETAPSGTLGARTATPPPPEVENIAPTAVASATPDPAVIDKGNSVEVTFDGSQSSDPDGAIVGWSWKDEAGIEIADTVSFSTRLRAGSHAFTLEVTDNQGAMSSVTVAVVVTKPSSDGNKGKSPKG